MHIPDGFISPQTYLPAYVLAAGFWTYAARRVKQKLDADTLPFLAAYTALSFVLNYYIRERMGKRCRFLGLDLAPGVIRSSREMADALGYRNMTFLVQDLRSWEPDPAFPVDLCMSLHACDAATDYSLHAGIRSGAAAIVCVPCCQRELLRQFGQRRHAFR